MFGFKGINLHDSPKKALNVSHRMAMYNDLRMKLKYQLSRTQSCFNVPVCVCPNDFLCQQYVFPGHPNKRTCILDFFAPEHTFTTAGEAHVVEACRYLCSPSKLSKST